MLENDAVAIGADAFAATCAQVAAYLVETAGLKDAVADALAAVDWNAFANAANLTLAGSRPTAFVEGCLDAGKGAAAGADVPAPVLGLVLAFALRAHLQAPAEEAARATDIAHDSSAHNHPLTCPFCGSPAAVSVVGKVTRSDGEGRIQYCATCGTTWEFERIRCGKCGERLPGKLHYYHIEGDSAHRIHQCDECGGYERVVFQSDLDVPLSLEAEDVRMANLDQVALDPRFLEEVQE